jgi:hypothetical protein
MQPQQTPKDQDTQGLFSKHSDIRPEMPENTRIAVGSDNRVSPGRNQGGIQKTLTLTQRMKILPIKVMRLL